jgi:hypothetical protein
MQRLRRQDVNPIARAGHGVACRLHLFSAASTPGHDPRRANDLVSLHYANQMLIPCSREQLLKSGGVSHVIPFEALELPSTGDKYGARLQQSVQTSLRNPRQRSNYKLTRKMGCECSVESPCPASCLRMLGSRTYAIQNLYDTS